MVEGGKEKKNLCLPHCVTRIDKTASNWACGGEKKGEDVGQRGSTGCDVEGRDIFIT